MALSDVVARVVAVLRAGYPHGALGGSSRRAVPTWRLPCPSAADRTWRAGAEYAFHHSLIRAVACESQRNRIAPRCTYGRRVVDPPRYRGRAGELASVPARNAPRCASPPRLAVRIRLAS